MPSRLAGANGGHSLQRLAAEIGEGPERRLMLYLIERGQPVNPTKAQSDTGIETSKRSRTDSLTWVSSAAGFGMKRQHSSLVVGCSTTTSQRV